MAAGTSRPPTWTRRALRSDAISQGASVVAAIPEVRRALLGFQRQFGSDGPGAVLAGRDIGTVVRPDASHKIFVHGKPARNGRGGGARSCRPWACRLYMSAF